MEAIAPGPGDPEKVDSVPALVFGVIQDIPEKQILLRFTDAISQKSSKYDIARRKGIIGAEDGYVIAINGWQATGFRHDPSLPYVMKAVLAIGDLTVLVSRDPTEKTQSFYQRKLEVVKTNLSPVSTKAFLSQEYGGISGLLYSSYDIVNAPEPLGSEMFFLHNPMANHPIDGGTFRFGSEYRYSVETEQLQRCDWRKDSSTHAR